MTHTATHSPACSAVAERGMWRAARCCRAAARAAARQHACLRASQPHHVPCCASALPERGWGAQPSTSGRPAAAALHAAAVEAAPSTRKAGHHAEAHRAAHQRGERGPAADTAQRACLLNATG